MVVGSIQCEHCGAYASYKSNAEYVECSYCGSLLKVDGPGAAVRRALNTKAEKEPEPGNFTEDYLKQGNLHCAQRSFVQARKYFEWCLELNADEDRALIGLLMVRLEVSSLQALRELKKPLEIYPEFNKAVWSAPEGRKQVYLECSSSYQDPGRPDVRTPGEERLTDYQPQPEEIDFTLMCVLAAFFLMFLFVTLAASSG